MNQEYRRVRAITDMVWAFRIALGRARFPDEWIDLLSDSPQEAASWRAREFRNEL